MLQQDNVFPLVFTTAPYECRYYKILKDGDRSVDYKGKTSLCDDVLDFGSWYRFMGAAGTQLSTSCVPYDRCGANYPLWMDGEYPTVDKGRVKRPICETTGSNCCYSRTEISVTNCDGFYVHKFSTPPDCPDRYCGDRRKGKSNKTYIS